MAKNFSEERAKALIDEYLKKDNQAEESLKQLREFYLEANGNYYYRTVCMYCSKFDCNCEEENAGPMYRHIDNIMLYDALITAEFNLEEGSGLTPYIWEEMKKRGYIGKITDAALIDELETNLL